MASRDKFTRHKLIQGSLQFIICSGLSVFKIIDHVDYGNHIFTFN